MDEIHEWLLTLLLSRKGEKKTNARTTAMFLTANCRVAKLNFTRVNDCRSKIAYRRWIDLLINGSMIRHYEKEDTALVVDYDPDNDIVDIEPESEAEQAADDGENNAMEVAG